MITLTINRAEISADKTELMTRGMANAITCRFVFSTIAMRDYRARPLKIDKKMR